MAGEARYGAADLELNEPRRSDEGAGATVAFPFDAVLIERFRAAFPRARWQDETACWFVPGKTADRRIAAWLRDHIPSSLALADQRGRDAFDFEPIESPYLEAAGDLLVRTPFSKTVIDALRAIPWAAWDPDLRVWRVPFRSVERLRERWLTIEAAARRAEPAERRRRQAELKASPEYEQYRQRAAERRRKRFPAPLSDLPPFGRVVMTSSGAIVAIGTEGELAEPESASTHYPDLAGDSERIWIDWRFPSLDELVRTWPARAEPDANDIARGWWQPSLRELRAERRKARSAERAAATRAAKLGS